MNIFSFIKSRIAILDIVGDYATLKRAGAYWKGSCPFHHERSASFTVSPHREIFYCFGCGAGGDVIAFIAQAEHCSQLEAVRYIAERYGIELPKDVVWEKSEVSAEQKRTYHALCAFVATWCTKKLAESAEAQKYISQNRNISAKIAQQFALGYYPRGTQGLKDLLSAAHNEGFSTEDFIKAHILIEGKHGLYSPFEERIIFPIRDHVSRFCGFGGRVFLPSDDRAKYYNSHEHDFFNKSSILFGFDIAKKSIQERDTVFLVEGNIDCIAMVQAGYINTVATLGTACTIEHLKLLQRYAKKMYVVYDGDAAGQKAIMRLTQLCWDVNMELFVIKLPENDDPASLLSRDNDFSIRIETAQDIFLFYLETLGAQFNKQGLQDRLASVKQMLDIIAIIPDQVKKDLLLQQAAARFELPLATLRENLQRIVPKTTIKSGYTATILGEDQANREKIKPDELQKKLFYAIINNNILLPYEQSEFLIAHFTAPLNLFLRNFQEYRKQHTESVLNHFFDACDRDDQEYISKVLIEGELGLPTSYDELLMQFYKKQWKMIVNDVKIKLAQASSTDTQEILTNFQDLKHKIFKKDLV